MTDIQVVTADWYRDTVDIRRIRDAVFVQEQGVSPEQEWDSEDASATHFLAYQGEHAIGTARLLPTGTIGRVSVLKPWRGLAIGTALLEAAITEAERQGLHEQTLDAQVQATSFYERLGFKVQSEEFIEAGIPHVEMHRNSNA